MYLTGLCRWCCHSERVRMQPQFVVFFNLIFFSSADLYNLIISHLLSVSSTGFFSFFFSGGLRCCWRIRYWHSLFIAAEASDSFYTRWNVTVWARWSHQCSFLFGATCGFGWNEVCGGWGESSLRESHQSWIGLHIHKNPVSIWVGFINACMPR